MALVAAALVAGACGGAEAPDASAPVEAAETGPPLQADGEVGAGGSRDEGGDPGAAQPNEAGDEAEEHLPQVAPIDTTTTIAAIAARGDDAGAGTPAEPAPRSGGTLRVGVEAEADGLNPAANNFAASAYIMAYPLFDPLAYYDAEGNWVPYLAESFSRIGDGTVWRMKLRDGVRFHDGTDMTADDVIATVRAQLADPVISLVYRNTIEPEGFITKIDDLTVEMQLARPSARFPQAFTSQLGMVLPSEWLELARVDPTLNQEPVGQGPFMISSRVQDVATVLVRNPTTGPPTASASTWTA